MSLAVYSQVPHHRRPADQHGQDRFLHDLYPSPREQTAEFPEIRPRGAEEGAVFGGEEREIDYKLLHTSCGAVMLWL